MTTFLTILFSLILIGIGIIIYSIYQAKKATKRQVEMLMKSGLTGLMSKLTDQKETTDTTKSE